MSLVEHGLASAIGFVTKPIGAAVTAVAVTALVGGGIYVKNWWDGVQQMDETILAQTGTITTLRTDLHSSEQHAADARVEFGNRIADLQHQVQTNAQEASWQRSRNQRLAARLEALQHEETGPLAPVLVSALNGVRDDLRGLSPT